VESVPLQQLGSIPIVYDGNGRVQRTLGEGIDQYKNQIAAPLWKALNTPIVQPDEHHGLVTFVQDQIAKDPNYAGAHWPTLTKIVYGAGEGAAGLLAGLTSPLSIATLGLSGVGSKLARTAGAAYFGGQAAYGAAKGAGQTYQDVQSGDVQKASADTVETLLNAAFAYGATRNAAAGLREQANANLEDALSDYLWKSGRVTDSEGKSVKIVGQQEARDVAKKIIAQN